MRHIAAPPWHGDSDFDPLVATGRPLRWGVVATGGIATRVTAQLAAMADAALVAVSSRDAGRATKFANEHGFARSYSDTDAATGYQRLAADPEVEVVYVATPHGQHHEVTAALLTAGKHVLVEKAFTINAREARELAELARERQLFLMEALWTRFLPAFQYALDVVERGEIGAVRYLQAELGFTAVYDPRSRLWAPEAGGGALLDLAVYPLTWAIGALGYPGAVHATGSLNDDGIDVQEALTLSYAGGEHAQLLTSLVTAARSQARIVGSEGSLATDGSLTRPGGIVVTTDDHVHRQQFSTAGLYAYQLREVTRCLQQGLRESPTMPLAHSVKTMELLDEARVQLGVSYPNDEFT